MSVIESLDDLIRMVRGELRDQAEQAAELVNQWFDEEPARYVEAVLASALGSHHEQYSVYQHLTNDRRVAFHQQAVASCAAEGRSGLTAGAFMLGRFICTSHAVAFWNQLDDREVAFLLDEWVQHARYLKVLDEVGERRIARARELIEQRGLPDIRVSKGDAMVFISLKLSDRDLADLANHLGDNPDVAATQQLLDVLRRPYSEFFDFAAPWSIGRLRLICAEAGIELPLPDDR